MRVLIFRHAEKPEGAGDPHLSSLGWRRAGAMARRWRDWAGPAQGLFAAAARESSNRPVETVSLLATTLRLPILCDLATEQTDALAARLRAPDAPWRAGTALVCWRHETIPAIAAALGAPGVPGEWPAGDYDPLWCVSVAADGSVRLDTSGVLPGPEGSSGP